MMLQEGTVRHPLGCQPLMLPPHPWVNCSSEAPSSSILSNPPRGCLLFTAVDVRGGVAGILFSCRLSSWDEETSSLCCLAGPAKQQKH